MKIDKGEICRNYRYAKNKAEQVQILAELNAIDRGKVIDILIQGGEKVRIPVPGKKSRFIVNEMTDEQYIKALSKRLDALDGKIRPLEREYREIIKVLESYGTKKSEIQAAAVTNDIRTIERLWEDPDDKKIPLILDAISDLRRRIKRLQKEEIQ